MVDYKKFTLVQNAIHSPKEPRHFMTLKKLECSFEVMVGSTMLVQSEKAISLSEVAHIIIDPVLYFPRSDISMNLLKESEQKTFCPLKGHAQYFHFVSGDEKVENIGWSYQEPISIAGALKGYVAFDSRLVRCQQIAP